MCVCGLANSYGNKGSTGYTILINKSITYFPLFQLEEILEELKVKPADDKLRTCK